MDSSIARSRDVLKYMEKELRSARKRVKSLEGAIEYEKKLIARKVKESKLVKTLKKEFPKLTNCEASNAAKHLRGK